MVISEFVFDEAEKGDALAAKERLAILEGMAEIPVDARCEILARLLLQRGALPAQALYDALHVAVCAINQVDILVIWNCKHIANVTMYSLMEQVCQEAGFTAPRICTPVELWGM